VNTTSLKIKRHKLRNFGVDVDGDPIQNSTVEKDDGPLIYVADVKAGLDKLVALSQLTPDARALIEQQLGL
jgi:hypothetical protein